MTGVQTCALPISITSIEVGKYTASLGLAYKIAHHFNLTIEEVFDFSEIENEE